MFPHSIASSYCGYNIQHLPLYEAAIHEVKEHVLVIGPSITDGPYPAQLSLRK